MSFFDSDGIPIHYLDTGEGRPLLLLHGLTSNHRMFDREIHFWKDRYRIIAPDARVHGESGRPEQYTLDDHIADVIRLLDHLHIDETDVIGVSMGSYIAQGLAVRQPARVRKLVLVATKSHGRTSSMAELLDRHSEELDGMNLIDRLNAAQKYVYRQHDAISTWQKKISADSRLLTGKEQAIASSALNAFDFREQLTDVTAETLVISGRHDGLNPPDKGRETAVLIPHADYMEFNDSGHAPNVEQDRLFLDVVGTFLEITAPGWFITEKPGYQEIVIIHQTGGTHMASKELAMHEKLEVHEVLTLKTAAVAKSRMFVDLVKDEKLKSLIEEDIELSTAAIKDLKKILKDSTK